MTLHWMHKFVSTKTDGIDSTLVKPSNWNDEHKVSTDTVTGVVLGRDNQGAGDIEELPASWDPIRSCGVYWELLVGCFPAVERRLSAPRCLQQGRFDTTRRRTDWRFSPEVHGRRSRPVHRSVLILGGDLPIGPGSSVNWQSYVEFYDYDGSFNAASGIWSPQIAGAYQVSAFGNYGNRRRHSRLS